MSSNKITSYLWVEDLPLKETYGLFDRAKTIKSKIASSSQEQSLKNKQIILFFSEASTRTKVSFQMAAQRLGAQCLMVDDVLQSSMAKGESFADTFKTLQGMGPDAMVVRCGDDSGLDSLVASSEVPIVNAGYGSKEHPTQALLDTFTLYEHFGSVENLKVLFTGDIDHSRVARSDIKLLKAMGAEVRICAPDLLYQKSIAGIENFSNLKEAIAWCDVYCGLRVQFERHQSNGTEQAIKKEFLESYSLTREGLDILKSGAVIIHPGPVNWGVEFSPDVADDSRFLMWKQKQNGVFVRAALLEKILEVNK